MARNHSNWLNAYLAYSDNSEAPEDFHLWTGISVIAGALRRKVWIEQKLFQWTPNMYIVFVAPPGVVSKSTTAAIGMNLLKQVDGVKFGPDVVTWQSLVQQLGESHEMFKVDPKDEEMHSMSPLTIVSSEFGTFLNPQDREMVDALVSLWDGQVGTWTKATKTQGSDKIVNPWLNVLACTTPDWIAGNFPEYMIGGGFTSRTMFIYADTKRHFVAYPGNKMDYDVQGLRNSLIQDLGHIANLMAGEYKMTKECEEWGEEWYIDHNTKAHPHLAGERFGGYLARKQSHIHKVAMVLAAAESDRLVLEKHHLMQAAALVTNLEMDMPKVFNRIGVATIQKDMKALCYYVHAQGQCTDRELYMRAASVMSKKQYEDCMSSAMATGWVVRKQVGNDVVWGRGGAITDGGLKDAPARQKIILK